MRIADVAPVINAVIAKATVDILWLKLNALDGDPDQVAEWQKAFGLLFDRYPSFFHLPSVEQSQAWKYSMMVPVLLMSQQFEDACLPLFNAFENVAAGVGVVPGNGITLQQALQQSNALLQFLKIQQSAEVTYFAQKLLHSLLIHATTSCYAKAKPLVEEFVKLCNGKNRFCYEDDHLLIDI